MPPSIAFSIAAVGVAAFHGPTWAWVTLVVFAALFVLAELAE